MGVIIIKRHRTHTEKKKKGICATKRRCPRGDDVARLNLFGSRLLKEAIKSKTPCGNDVEVATVTTGKDNIVTMGGNISTQKWPAS